MATEVLHYASAKFTLHDREISSSCQDDCKHQDARVEVGHLAASKTGQSTLEVAALLDWSLNVYRFPARPRPPVRPTAPSRPIWVRDNQSHLAVRRRVRKGNLVVPPVPRRRIKSSRTPVGTTAPSRPIWVRDDQSHPAVRRRAVHYGNRQPCGTLFVFLPPDQVIANARGDYSSIPTHVGSRRSEPPRRATPSCPLAPCVGATIPHLCFFHSLVPSSRRPWGLQPKRGTRTRH
jgi:hypothetical protein